MDELARSAQVDEHFASAAPAMRRTAYVIVRDWHIAEDMVQTTFVKLYVAWPRIRQESLAAYSRRTLVNTCLTHLRKSRREHVTDVLPDSGIEDRHSGVDLRTALGLLPAQQRAVVALRYLDDLSIGEVAAALDIAPGSVKSQTSRALENLRRQLPALSLDEETVR